jgi:hypothetical protein
MIDPATTLGDDHGAQLFVADDFCDHVRTRVLWNKYLQYMIDTTSGPCAFRMGERLVAEQGA